MSKSEFEIWNCKKKQREEEKGKDCKDYMTKHIHITNK